MHAGHQAPARHLPQIRCLCLDIGVTHQGKSLPPALRTRLSWVPRKGHPASELSSTPREHQSTTRSSIVPSACDAAIEPIGNRTSPAFDSWTIGLGLRSAAVR